MSGKNSKPTNRFHVVSPRKNKHTDINNSVMDEPLVSKTDSVGTSQAVDSQDPSQAMALSPALDARLKRMEDTICSIVPSIRQDIHDLKEAQEQKFEIITDNVNKIKQELHSVKSENSKLRHTMMNSRSGCIGLRLTQGRTISSCTTSQKRQGLLHKQWLISYPRI